MPVEVKPVFIAAGANAESGAFDEFAGRCAYASGRNVVIVDDLEAGETVRKLQFLPDPPTGPVHSLQFVNSKDVLLVGSDDHSVRKYSCAGADAWSLQEEWKLPDAVMICREFEGFCLAVTSKAQLFTLCSVTREAKAIFSATSGRKLTSLALAKLPDSSPLLAVGVSDCTIRLLSGEGRQLLSLTGHQNWTTSLQFRLDEEAGALMLLSASLDKTVRLWKIVPVGSLDTAMTTSSTMNTMATTNTMNTMNTANTMNTMNTATNTISSNSSNSTISTNLTSLKELVPQQNTFNGWRCEMDAVALGHEGAVHFARFIHDASGSLKILSGAADRSVIIWRRFEGDGAAGAWIPEVQLAEASDYSLLFVGGSLMVGDDESECLVAVSSTGSVATWKRRSGEWIQSTPITGHTGAVEQCVWVPSSSILLSCSADQTTRAFSIPARLELSRPQIHGYDLKCLAVYSTPEEAIHMVSGADEKVLRVFAAPDQFYSRAGRSIGFTAPAAAQLPALGLSNKLLASSDEGYNSAFLPSTSSPLERELTKQSLWPEVDKLYAHNRELSCLAVDSGAQWMASAAKGTKAADAAVCIWRNREGTWKLVKSLELHNLTVTKMAFSGAGRLLVASRDRSISLLQFPADGESVHVEVKGFEAHPRQIWAATWIDSEHFLTGGREGLLKWWRYRDGQSQPELLKQIQFDAGITAVAWHAGLVAVGDERGVVQVSSVKDASFGPVATCADAVTDLKWNSDGGLLAITSADHSVRVLQFCQ